MNELENADSKVDRDGEAWANDGREAVRLR